MFKSLVALALVVGVSLTMGSGLAFQGGYYTSATSYTATRSNIQRVNLSPAAGSMALFASRVEDADSLVLLQAGYIKHNGHTSPCGNATYITAFVDWFGLDGHEHCLIYFVGTTGTNERYSVLRESGDCWTGYRSGSPMGTCHRIQTETGRMLAVVEYLGAGGTLDACFGCEGLTKWQVATVQPNYSDVVTCHWRTAPPNASGWSRTCPPSPFSIRR